MARLEGKIAIVTGGSRGIGEAIVRTLCEEGAFVIFTYNNNEEKAKSLVKELKAKGYFLQACPLDLNNYSSIENFNDVIISKQSNLDILINNAGISKVGLFMDASKSEVDEMINTNLTGSILLSQFAVKKMIDKKKGSIVNISSIWGNVGASCEVLYSATKGGINIFTKALAKELGPSGIRVNAVAPGVIDTEMNKWMNETDRMNLEQEIPLDRFGDTKEVAKVVSFLCSDESSYVTGQIITVDGGMI
ncbi:elongation factor P 5-aminopentanone reductase [Inconstantimicrobium mannanitabidum]|uniref:3-ketoacyl-ACP reductase n=1 Tax=Inconstantimicrobium mannanitabidum TaxID=1604901 RepID=A0ACB5RAJ1_9CLOT|nr:SDR family oxidoreductase [Clostridium sp. TW13]GKX66056.1 3-ketoacyl-ACP reductase [Clostridium sp. TW13]